MKNLDFILVDSHLFFNQIIIELFSQTINYLKIYCSFEKRPE